MDSIDHWKRIVYIVSAVVIGTGISIIGVISFIPLFLTSELGVEDPGEAAFWAGLISGVTPFFVSMAAPYWTLKADKKGAKFSLVVIVAVLTVVIGAMYFTSSPWEMLFLRMLQGMCGGFIPVGMSLVMHVTPKEKMPWAMGVFQAAMVMGVMFGPLAGGLVADLFGYRMPFIAFSVLSLLCLLAIIVYLPKGIGKGEGKKRESFWKNFSYFLRNPVVRLMVMLQFLCNCGMTGIGPILPLYIKEMMGGDAMAVATIVGVMIFAAGGTSVISSLSVARLAARVPIASLLIVASTVTGLNFMLQYLMPEVISLGVMRGLVGCSLGMIMPLANTVLASSVPSEKRTVVVGFAASFSLMGNVAGPMASGALAMQWGYGMVFWSTAAFFLLAALVIYKDRGLIK